VQDKRIYKAKLSPNAQNLLSRKLSLISSSL